MWHGGDAEFFDQFRQRHVRERLPEHRPDSRSVQVHSAATRGSPHIAVPSPLHIPLACRAHQSECGQPE